MSMIIKLNINIINKIVIIMVIRRLSVQTEAASVCQHLITVRLKNAEGVPPENSQRHSLELEITLTLILKSHGKSATQILKKLDRRFPHGAGRLDSNWLDLPSSIASHSIL